MARQLQLLLVVLCASWLALQAAAQKGANMAITGTTAMDAPFFRSLGLSDKIWNNGPISFQLQWFQTIKTINTFVSNACRCTRVAFPWRLLQKSMAATNEALPVEHITLF
ncbi:GDSL esterase/lipase [Hordeum vulgare]|nr:GDSL esterase/lipase [Hordeum vulgare]KAI5000002.1 hypothetical protein ZWY2020_004591 [Hordeum vulgare]